MKKDNISLERKKYLRKIFLNKMAVLVTQIVVLVGFIAIWEILAQNNVIDSFITSQPSRVWKTFLNLSQNDLLHHIGVTTLETITGFLLGSIIGVLIAILLWSSEFLSKVSEPFLVVLSSLPKVALGPIIIIWVGARNRSYYSFSTGNFFNSNNT